MRTEWRVATETREQMPVCARGDACHFQVYYGRSPLWWHFYLLVVRGNGEPYEMSKGRRVGTCWSAPEMSLFAATRTFSFGQTDTAAFTISLLLVVCGKANVVGSF
jgi:hypothetical protein